MSYCENCKRLEADLAALVKIEAAHRDTERCKLAECQAHQVVLMRLLQEWLDTDYYEKRELKWMFNFRPRVEYALAGTDVSLLEWFIAEAVNAALEQQYEEMAS